MKFLVVVVDYRTAGLTIDAPASLECDLPEQARKYDDTPARRLGDSVRRSGFAKGCAP